MLRLAANRYSSKLTVSTLPRAVMRGIRSHMQPRARSFCGESEKLWWGARYPITFGTGIATVKTAAADIFTQKVLEKREELDKRRVALFTAFGFAYLGLFQYWMYVTLFSRWFAGTARFVEQPLKVKIRDRAGQLDLCKQIAFDNFVHIQWFFPMYYILKQSIVPVTGNAFDTPFSEVVSTALSKYGKNYWDDWIAFWKVWIVGDIFVMGFMPLWARLPVNHGLSFIYIIILSFMRGAEEKPPIKDRTTTAGEGKVASR
jgi:protein Mpv17